MGEGNVNADAKQRGTHRGRHRHVEGHVQTHAPFEPNGAVGRRREGCFRAWVCECVRTQECMEHETAVAGWLG